MEAAHAWLTSHLQSCKRGEEDLALSWVIGQECDEGTAIQLVHLDSEHRTRRILRFAFGIAQGYALVERRGHKAVICTSCDTKLVLLAWGGFFRTEIVLGAEILRNHGGTLIKQGVSR